MNQANTPSPAPGGIYLCQVNHHISCAACCGLYNAADCSIAGLQQMLSERTRGFASVQRNAEAICEFGRRVQSLQLRRLPWADFHHCPYIGLIGAGRQRVGCLLHPLAEGNNGVDYRGLSYYGAMACRQYFCPSHRDLAPEIKTMIQRLAENWYEYGLVITEASLLAEVMSEIEKRLPESLSVQSAVGHPAGERALREVLFLKIKWPYRRSGGRGLCHYFFSDCTGGKEPVDYGGAGRRPAGFEKILYELNSRFQTADELRSAERRLDQMFRQAAEAVRKCSL